MMATSATGCTFLTANVVGNCRGCAPAGFTGHILGGWQFSGIPTFPDRAVPFYGRLGNVPL